MATTAPDYYMVKNSYDTMLTKTLAEFMTQYKSDLEAADWSMAKTMAEFMTEYKDSLDWDNMALAKTLAELEGTVFDAKGYYYAVSDDLLASDDTEYEEADTTKAKQTEITVPPIVLPVTKSTFRIKFDLLGHGGYDGNARLHRNGEAIGTERNAIPWTTFSEDLTGWVGNDTIELWAWATGAHPATVKNFRIYGVGIMTSYTDTPTWG